MFFFVQKMLRVKDEEFSLREKRDNYHKRRRYSDDYDSEVELYQQYKSSARDSKMVGKICMLLLQLVQISILKGTNCAVKL